MRREEKERVGKVFQGMPCPQSIIKRGFKVFLLSFEISRLLIWREQKQKTVWQENGGTELNRDVFVFFRNEKKKVCFFRIQDLIKFNQRKKRTNEFFFPEWKNSLTDFAICQRIEWMRPLQVIIELVTGSNRLIQTHFDCFRSYLEPKTGKYLGGFLKLWDSGFR